MLCDIVREFMIIFVLFCR